MQLNTCIIACLKTTDIRADTGHRTRQSEFEAEVKRKHFTTKQDIANVRVKVKDLTVIRTQEDAVSVDLFVRELQQEPYNPVLLYKHQGENDPAHPTLPKESFLLAVQTELQRQLYKDHASKVLCIDATHGTNAYQFKLISVMIADEYGQGMCWLQGTNSVYNKGGNEFWSILYYRISCGMVH